MGNAEKWTALVEKIGVTAILYHLDTSPSTLNRWRHGGHMSAEDFWNACRLLQRYGVDALEPPRSKRVPLQEPK